MTTQLAVLLRRAANKYPDKFNIEVGELTSDEYFWVDGYEFRVEATEDSYECSMDALDAIAAAAGMRFDVVMNLLGVYAARVWHPTENGQWRVSYPEFGFYHADKRLASIAALCAILELKLKEGE